MKFTHARLQVVFARSLLAVGDSLRCQSAPATTDDLAGHLIFQWIKFALEVCLSLIATRTTDVYARIHHCYHSVSPSLHSVSVTDLLYFGPFLI